MPQPSNNSTVAGAAIPTIAIVGRPNVGKSTLFNRILGSRRAIVGDEPGITRDRLYGDAEWAGRKLRIVDTGGILPEEKDLLPAEIFRQARVALQESSAIIMVVDGRSELSGPDLELVRLLRRANRPLFLAVNKIDSEKQSSLMGDFHRLGIQQMFPVSAEHGRGVDDLLDAVVAEMPKAVTREGPEEPQVQVEPTTLDQTRQPEVKVAIIGHPNVGKSTLLNCLTSSERAIVSPIPGTTRDAVDEVVERDGRKFRFIDTAGIRRKGKTHLMAEKLAVVMARKHLEAADIALLVIDATEGVSQLDAAIAGYAHESGRSIIIVVNKWDLMIAGLKRTGRPTKAQRMRESKRGLRGPAAVRAQVSELCACRLYFGAERQGNGEDLSSARESCSGTTEARDDCGDESVSGARGFRPRFCSRAAAGEDPLYDAGLGGSADVCAVHQPRGETALRLPALPRE